MRVGISPVERLALTLRYLATGNSQVIEHTCMLINELLAKFIICNKAAIAFLLMATAFHVIRCPCHSASELGDLQCQEL